MGKGYSSELHDAKSLVNIAASLNDFELRLTALAALVRNSGVGAIEIKGQAEMLRAMKGLEAFLKHGNDEMRRVFDEQGAYKAGSSVALPEPANSSLPTTTDLNHKLPT